LLAAGVRYTKMRLRCKRVTPKIPRTMDSDETTDGGPIGNAAAVSETVLFQLQGTFRKKLILSSRFAGIFTLLVLLTLINPWVSVGAFEWSAGSSTRVEVNRKAIAGIWKLTPILQKSEVTLYRKKPSTTKPFTPELLLLLREDGFFQKYDALSTDESITIPTDDVEIRRNVDINTSWQNFHNNQKDEKCRCIEFIQKGTWAFLDGNLILAAGRANASAHSQSTHNPSYSTLEDGMICGASINKQNIQWDEIGKSRSCCSTYSELSKEDTLLKGRVVASYQARLDNNPILIRCPENKIQFDTHLLVPCGSINVGKFLYPMHHPSFFEQPMLHPATTGTFVLDQILGNLNMAHQDPPKDIVVEQPNSDLVCNTMVDYEMREASNFDTHLVIGFLGQLQSFHDSLLTGSAQHSAPLIKAGNTIQSLMPHVRNGHVILVQPTLSDGCLGPPVGFASYHLKYLGFGPPLMHMEHLFVNPSSRSQGAGLALMNELASIGKTSHCSHMEWNVHQQNFQGIAFYHRIGATRMVHAATSCCVDSTTMNWIPSAWDE
jgi:ribosomal protein S18 acetylase RimI-like enzyme